MTASNGNNPRFNEKEFKMLKRLATVSAAGILSLSANATVVYNDWLPDGQTHGNYSLLVTENQGDLKFDLTVNPWNAEALGLFVDLGNVNIGSVGNVTLKSVAPVGQVTTYAVDQAPGTQSYGDCGNGCNLNGLQITPEWDLVFRLGTQGFNSIQTFSWTTHVAGLELKESMLGLVGIRAQQLCPQDSTLPGGIRQCEGSDKAYGYGSSNSVPEPMPLGLIGIAGLTAGILSRRKRQA